MIVQNAAAVETVAAAVVAVVTVAVAIVVAAAVVAVATVAAVATAVVTVVVTAEAVGKPTCKCQKGADAIASAPFFMPTNYPRTINLDNDEADTLGMKTIVYNGHRIDAPGSTLTGLDVVRYDGNVVSSKRSVLGANHPFEMEENGETVQYLVSIGTRWHGFSATCKIFRNGELLFSDC